MQHGKTDKTLQSDDSFSADRPPLQDSFRRRVNYLRISVTDRCDFRCVYCMAEDMKFLPRSEILDLEEIVEIAGAFVRRGVEKIRLTGGEPLLRRGLPELVSRLKNLPGLQELALTTNGARLDHFAGPLKAAGLDRINISLDSLKADRFSRLTRTGRLSDVLRGVDAALAHGYRNTKINAVILKGRNDDEVLNLLDFAVGRKLDLSFIEEMPLGQITEHSRKLSFMSSAEIRLLLEAEWQLTPVDARSGRGGPSRYWKVEGTESRVGFISPHSNNFCSQCNRVRLTADGRLLLCLGNEHSLDFKQVLRDSGAGKPLATRMDDALETAMMLKPERHHFDLDTAPQIIRFMNATGG